MFTLTLVTPERRLVAGQEIEEIFIPGFRGELNILPGHAPLMTTLRPGVVKYRLKGATGFQYAAVSWGYAQVNPEGVSVLAETADRPDEINLEANEVELKEAETALKSSVTAADDIEKLQGKVEAAHARKEVAAHRTAH